MGHDSRKKVAIALAVGGFLVLAAIAYFSIFAFNPQWRAINTGEVEWPADADVADLLAEPTRTIYGAVIVGGPANPFTRKATGTFILIRETQRVLTIWKLDASGEVRGATNPAMHLEISHLIKNRFGTVMPDGGRPPVYCDLNQQQADYVLQNGVPQSLIDAMLRAADAAGWQPLPQEEDRTTDRATIIWVSPTPHFPK